MEPPYLRDVRDGALLVEHPGLADEDANRVSVALGERLRALGEPGILDAVPGARTLLVLFEPELLPRERVAELAGHASESDLRTEVPGRLVRIPVVYDGEDLGEISRRTGLPPPEVARRHAGARYKVAFVGFAPGFAYLSGLPAELATSRLSAPRPRVPVGSVAIGGPWTGVYPSASPGGWRLIGRTSVRIFDPRAQPPSLLSPGDRVVFEAVPAAALPPTPPEAGEPPVRRALVRVLSGGLFSTVQGRPRYGLGSSGVPAGGAMDSRSFARANALVGNSPEAGALELTLDGPELEFLEDTVFAVSGAGVEATLGGRRAPVGEAVRASSRERLRLGRTHAGARAYLAVRGGLLGPGLRGGPTRRLVAGESIAAGSHAAASGASAGPETVIPEEVRFRVLLGPEAESFSRAEQERFFASSWRLTPESDRRGLRLDGVPLAHSGEPEIAPSGTVAGVIQVPGNGLPIVLGPDGPVTGGYPRIATVIGADLWLLGQLRPGQVVRFQEVYLPEALLARNKMRFP